MMLWDFNIHVKRFHLIAFPINALIKNSEFRRCDCLGDLINVVEAELSFSASVCLSDEVNFTCAVMVFYSASTTHACRGTGHSPSAVFLSVK